MRCWLVGTAGLVVALVGPLLAVGEPGEGMPDIGSIPPDLAPPALIDDMPGPGVRARQACPGYEGTDVHHLLYLPTDWRLDRTYPVIVEYPGNGPYTNDYGDTCSGLVEDCVLGFGISGGEGFIWLTLPFVDTETGTNQRQWWGDVEATVEYCLTVVRDVCARFGGDPSAVILTGFSRGAIACGYIGLHNDKISDLWRAFVPVSHYDGVLDWGYADADREAASERLERLRGRPSFVCHEGSVEATRAYIEDAGTDAPFTFMAIPFRNHRADWVLRDIPERQALRNWLADVLAGR